jgi:hypothetical protein
VDLFARDFGGDTFTYSPTHPPLAGVWEDGSGALVGNLHAQFTVYTQQSHQAVEYFKELKTRLQVLSRQQEILIDMVPVWLVESE